MIRMLLAIGLLFFSTLVFATAGGPDFYKVEGVQKNDCLNIRAKPSGTAKIIGTIPYNGRGIENTGIWYPPCYADVTPTVKELEQSTEFTAREKQMILNHEWWYKIRYNNIEGWVHNKYLTEDQQCSETEMQETEGAHQ